MRTTIPQWVDSDGTEKIDDVFYLVETLNTSTGRTSFALHERPLRTNQSREPRLYGWCGETDNRSRYARGVVRIIGGNRARDRARVVEVKGEEMRSFLEGDGYPELCEKVEA